MFLDRGRIRCLRTYLGFLCRQISVLELERHLERFLTDHKVDLQDRVGWQDLFPKEHVFDRLVVAGNCTSPAQRLAFCVNEIDIEHVEKYPTA